MLNKWKREVLAVRRYGLPSLMVESGRSRSGEHRAASGFWLWSPHTLLSGSAGILRVLMSAGTSVSLSAQMIFLGMWPGSEVSP